MIARPFVSLLETAMKQHRIKNAAELANLCGGKVSAPALYSILSGSTPHPKTVQVLCSSLGMSPTLAKQVRDEQSEIDRSLKRGPGRKKTVTEDFPLSAKEKAFIRRYRKLSQKAAKFIDSSMKFALERESPPTKKQKD